MKAHFLQSDIWREFQKSIGRKLVEGSGDGWSYVGNVAHDRYGAYVYVPYGPFAKNKKALEAAKEDLIKKAKQVGAYVVLVEPTPPITRKIASEVFKNKGVHRQAHRTILIDLNQSEDEIIAGMAKTRRKQHRNYGSKGLVIEKNNNLETLDKFYELLTISSKEKGFYVRDFEFFKSMYEILVPSGNASLFTAKRDGNTEVVALIYDDEDRRYYAHVGRDLSDNSLQASAPLISYMIIDAKRSGKKYFDIYGISESDDFTDEKSGFTVFKKSFGGDIVDYAGAWEIPIKPGPYYAKRGLKLLKKLVK